MREKKSFQIVCPKCKHEFRYDSQYYDSNIAKLNREIAEMREQLTEYKTFSPQKKQEWSNWRKQLLRRYEDKLNEARELKSHRKNFNMQVDDQVEKAFRTLVKQRLGEEEYIKLREEAERDCEAYKIADTMKHEYTRKGGEVIRRYNK